MLELCRVTASDGLHLDGSWEHLDECADPSHPSLLLIHGTGSNFYGAGVLASLARQAVADGFAVLRINTRGHDLAASIPGSQGPVQGGAAYEHVLDCRWDVTAWCDFLVARGRSQVILVGHSLGGVKALWSQALAPHPSVAGVVGISPPRFVHQRFQADPRCEPFRRSFAEAQRLVEAGEPNRLISVSQPLPLVITAEGFLEKYGPDDPLDYLRILSRISCPRLILVGSQSVESNVAFADLPAELAAAGATDCGIRCETIIGADINYRNDPTAPWQIVQKWIKGR